jgi:hypothetical protein
MKSRHQLVSLISLFALPLLLFYFQNCAPPGSLSAEEQSKVHLVDDLQKSQIQFVSPQVEIRDEATSVGIDGFCNSDYNGAQLRFSVWTDQNAVGPLFSGTSTCDHGRFRVVLSQLEQFVCGVSHVLAVEGAWGASAFDHFVRRCQPLASQIVTPPLGSPEGTVCLLEYSPVTEVAQPCFQVCYRDDKVVYSSSEQVGQCSTLASGLAGP